MDGYFYRAYTDMIGDAMVSGAGVVTTPDIEGIVFSDVLVGSADSSASELFEALCAKYPAYSAGSIDGGYCVSVPGSSLSVSLQAAVGSPTGVTLQVVSAAKSFVSWPDFYAYVFAGGQWVPTSDAFTGGGAGSLPVCCVHVPGFDASIEVFNIKIAVGTALEVS